MPASFALYGPGSVIKTLGKGFMELDSSGANMLIGREGVAVPNHNAHFPEAFNKCENELFLKSGVPASICARSGSVLGVSILDTNIRVLS